MVALAILIGVLIVLMIPIKLRFDSRQKRLTLQWMGLSVTKRLEKKKHREWEEGVVTGERRIIKTIGRLLLKDSRLALQLLVRAYHLLVGLVRSSSVRELEANFSTSDPMWNGVLYGLVGNVHRKNVRLSVNFQGINYLRGCFHIRPYRLLHVILSMLVRLPYRRIVQTILDMKKQRRKEESS